MKIIPVKFEDVAVGDTVYKMRDCGKYSDLPLKVIAKHQGVSDKRQYIVTAFKGDIPMTYQPHNLGKEHTPVVETITLFGSVDANRAYTTVVWPTHATTHKITYNIVDGEVDCSSIKMEKL